MAQLRHKTAIKKTQFKGIMGTLETTKRKRSLIIMVRRQGSFFRVLAKTIKVWRDMGYRTKFTSAGVFIFNPEDRYLFIDWDDFAFFTGHTTLKQGV